jgi:uncharacterized protein YlxW (UPF0749 family)
MATTNRQLQALQRKLERMELDHLRQLVAAQQEQIEQLQSDLELTQGSLDFWQRDAMNMLDALQDPEHANGRCIGLTKSGELLVVKMEGEHAVHH